MTASSDESKASTMPAGKKVSCWMPTSALILGVLSAFACIGYAKEAPNWLQVEGTALFGGVGLLFGALSLARRPHCRGQAVAGILLCISSFTFVAGRMVAPDLVQQDQVAQSGNANVDASAAPVANPMATVPAEKGGRFEGNYAHFGAVQIQAGGLAQAPYAIHVVAPLPQSNQDVPAERPTRIWLTHKLGQAGCGANQGKCNAEQIVDLVDGPQYGRSTAIVLPDNGIPCTWHDSQVLAFHNGVLPVLAAWRIDVQAEKIVAVPAGEVDCQKRLDEEGRGKRANDLLTDGWGGDAIHGHEAIQDLKQFQRIGEVVKEDTQPVPKDDNSAPGDEIHRYQYHGMSVAAYVARHDGADNITVNEVVITSRDWPVKYGLTVGTPRQKLEEILGEDWNMSDNPKEWSYGDGGAMVSFAFDGDDKVKLIRWHRDDGSN